MRLAYGRFALVAGVSLSALATAAPAMAAVTVSPGIGHKAAEDELVICLADKDCWFGVDAKGSGLVAAAVADVASGRIEQIGTAWSSAVDLDLTNHGRAKIAANAHAVASALGLASADASVASAVRQFGSDLGDVDLSLANDGKLVVEALAQAEATHALAQALINGGIVQTALAVDGNAIVDLDNGGTIDVGASAGAAAGENATAVAKLRAGIWQYAQSVDGVVAVELANDGAINMHAAAAATGTQAYAFATMSSALVQWGFNFFGTEDVAVGLTNNGSLNLSVAAAADGSGGPAQASAQNLFAAQQVAHAFDANAQVDFDNRGNLEFDVAARATGANAQAFADDRSGIFQVANAYHGNGNVSFVNSGTLKEEAKAKAEANQGAAAAIGEVNSGLIQAAGVGWGNADIGLINSGLYEFDVSASASGVTAAQATAYAIQAVGQFAGAAITGDAQVDFGNSGTLDVDATAHAIADSGTAAAYGIAWGIVSQSAVATNANVALMNDGTIDLAVVVDAEGVVASANAVARSVIWQSAATTHSGTSGSIPEPGKAAISLQNTGTLSVAVVGDAKATSGFARADINRGATQFAQSLIGDASATMVNNGSMSFLAQANATAETGDADGRARVYRAINQVAVASSGSAAVDFSNGDELALAANAHASASTVADAVAVVTDGIRQAVFGDVASASLGNSGLIQLGVSADANGDSAAWAAAGLNHAMTQAVQASDFANALISNSGTITFSAKAKAVADEGLAGAFAGMGPDDYGIEQDIADGETAVAAFTNSGLVKLAVRADAAGDSAMATAVGYGVLQYAATAATITEDLLNKGTIEVGVSARGEGNSAVAVATAEGVVQAEESGTVAYQTAINSGTIKVAATAVAEGGAFASASPQAWEGIEQNVGYLSTAAQSLQNSGTIELVAKATAVAASGSAFAFASVGDGLEQNATAVNSLTQQMLNSASLSLIANAKATGNDYASAFASVSNAMTQAASIVDGAYQTMTNEGYLTAGLAVVAHAKGELTTASSAEVLTGIAHALADADGMGQNVRHGTGVQKMTNSGTLDVTAKAIASGATDASAHAMASGAFQNATADNMAAVTQSLSFMNSGTIAVAATASAALNVTDNAAEFGLGHAYADASANGYKGHVGGYGQVLDSAPAGAGEHLQVVTAKNTGTISVAAKAIAPAGRAVAVAHGMMVVNDPTVVVHQTASGAYATVAEVGNAIEGAITNEGRLDVVAFASGHGTEAAPASGSTSTSGGYSSAFATGIRVDGGTNNLVIANTGAIHVDAVAAHGGSAGAIGIRITMGGDVVPTGADVLTITNSGTIIVRESVDGGETWRRGTAIDVSEAPNRSVINLVGGGKIYGDIDVQDGDTITVAAGETLLDGIVNPECVGASDANACGAGALNIAGDGVLVLADPRLSGDPDLYDGPSYAFVKALNVAAGGTLALALEAQADGAQDVGSYPQLFADTATLAGTLEARFAPANGLFADSYSWDDVIDANALSGEFDRCLLGGDHAGSPLLQLSCSYDNEDNVDLSLTRVAFNAVDGLNRNGSAVGSALEDLYDPDLTGGMGDLLADLFSIDDAADYNVALNQLSGSAYANYLQSFASRGVHYNDLIDRATRCDGAPLLSSVLECRTGPVRLWGELDVQKRTGDGDEEAGALHAKRRSALVGADAQVSGAALVGFSFGKVTNHGRDRQFGDTIKADGYQLGAYALYDPGAFYVKGVTTYGWYDGDSRRRIDLEPLGGTLAATLSGDPDVRLWTLGVHAGTRLATGASSLATPYLNLDHVEAKLQRFTETGLDGADLAVAGGTSNRTYLTAGVKWAADLGGLVPEVNLGYRYRFGSPRTRFTAAFDGFAGSPFTILSAADKRAGLLAGLSLGGKAGPVDLKLAYDGEYNGNTTSHSASLKLTLPLGKSGAAKVQPSQ